MSKKIYFKELTCYEKANEETRKHKLFLPERCFDLTQLPDTEVRKEMENFIIHRGEILSALSVRTEAGLFSQFCRFLQDSFTELQSLKQVDEAEVEKKVKVWLLKNGMAIASKRYRKAQGKYTTKEVEIISYVRKIYDFLFPKDIAFAFEQDVWHIKEMPLTIRTNPVKNTETISFKKITQETLREEMKQVTYVHLTQKSLGTVMAELTAVNRLSKFLSERHPEIQSFLQFDRDVIEDYLIHTHMEATGRKSYSNDLRHVKSVIVKAGKLLEKKELEHLFCGDDIARQPEVLYKVYSDDEIRRLNAAISEMEPQIFRAMIVHQWVGTRISETLSLRQDDIFQNTDGIWMIRIYQIKTRKYYLKALSEDLLKILLKSCEYTNEKHGKREYIFVSDKHPERAMQYSRIQHALMCIIREKDLRDDAGELFRVSTHLFRHVYARKLLELQIDDVTIAKMLGQANTSSLKHYRKISNQKLAEDTARMRDCRNNMLIEARKGWDSHGEA